MIIQYDTRPDATIDEKLRSLIESIQLGFAEVGMTSGNEAAESTDQDISSVIAEVRRLADAVTSMSVIVGNFDQRCTDIEDSITDIQTSITDVQATITQIETAITTIEGNITSLDERVTALENPENP